MRSSRTRRPAVAWALPASLLLRAAAAGAQRAPARTAEVLYDFVATPPRNEALAERAAADSLLQRFPHPTAGAGSRCDPNARGTPATERSGGVLFPTITTATGAFTRAGAEQTAYLVDYCATGVGQESLRRLLVLEGREVLLDLRVADAERILLARDADGDERDELLLLQRTYSDGRIGVLAQLVSFDAGRLRVRGRWDALRECGREGTRRTGLRLLRVPAARGFAVRAEPASAVCAYPPAPP